jgi:hypothetical protein
METNKHTIKRKITMKRIHKSLKIIGLIMVLSLFTGCKADELACKSVPQGEFVPVE